jgi:hypothetical protein
MFIKVVIPELCVAKNLLIFLSNLSKFNLLKSMKKNCLVYRDVSDFGLVWRGSKSLRNTVLRVRWSIWPSSLACFVDYQSGTLRVFKARSRGFKGTETQLVDRRIHCSSRNIHSSNIHSPF